MLIAKKNLNPKKSLFQKLPDDAKCLFSKINCTTVNKT